MKYAHLSAASSPLLGRLLGTAAAALAMVSGLSGCAGAGDEWPVEDEAEFGTTEQPVQIWGFGHYNIDDDSRAARSEGVIRALSPDGTYAFSCGVTFITPHFGITAAHCVDSESFDIDWNNSSDPRDDKFVVQQFDTGAIRAGLDAGNPLTAWTLLLHSIVNGTFPNYSQPNKLGCLNGYCITGHYRECRVRYRCSSRFGNENCPDAAKDDDVDIAMIHCADRPSSAAWADVTSANDKPGQSIDVHWYHELLNMPMDASDPNGPADGFEHYTAYNPPQNNPHPARRNNFHYSHGDQHQMIPLVSSTFPSGTPYKVLNTWSETSSTNAYGCHGTSGSGVFFRNSVAFLGPVTTGGSPIAGRLCNDPSKMGENVVSFNYIRPKYSRMLEDLVSWDR